MYYVIFRYFDFSRSFSLAYILKYFALHQPFENKSSVFSVGGPYRTYAGQLSIISDFLLLVLFLAWRIASASVL